MIYRLSSQLFVENGPTLSAAAAAARTSSSAFRAWRAMDEKARLALVENALKAA